MLVPVVVLTVLAVIGGWIQFAPIWTPVTSWLEPVARTLKVAEPTNAEEAISSFLAVAAGIVGIALAWFFYGAPVRRRLPRARAWRRLLERKFYADELYDALFYKPAAVLATTFRRGFEEPVVLEGGEDVADGAQEVGRDVSGLQTGLLRTYALALGAGAIVVAAVFLGVR
jgi:NADH-quinone oxidoreductase subunit L